MNNYEMNIFEANKSQHFKFQMKCVLKKKINNNSPCNEELQSK